MNVYRTNSMTKHRLFAKSTSTILLGAAILLGAPSLASADDKPAGSDQPAAAPAKSEGAVPLPAAPAVAQPAPAAAVTPPAAPVSADEGPTGDPPSVMQIGIQRLGADAYPDTENRGIRYGSLGLTFHGLQWPFMPSKGGPRFVLGVSGWGWVDTSYQKFSPWGDNPKIDASKIRYWVQQARLVTRFTPTYSLGSGWFVQGQAEFVATEDQTIQRGQTGGADTDDLWLRIGQWNKWDFQVGRYEGWEVFHLGMGLDLNTFERIGAYGQGDVYNPTFYGLTDNQYRPAGAVGNVAFHYYPTKYLRFELLSGVGSVGAYPSVSVRPVAIFDIGWMKLKAGTEYQKLTAQQVNDPGKETRKGVGGAIQFVLAPYVEFGLNAAQGTVWSVQSNGSFNEKGSLTRSSYGGFLNVTNASAKYPLVFGLGSIYTTYEDQFLRNDKVNEYWHLQNFVAVQYVAFQQLYIKLVGGYARAHWDTADPELSYEDEMYSVRLRLSLYF
jgi:hypothetical protein